MLRRLVHLLVVEVDRGPGPVAGVVHSLDDGQPEEASGGGGGGAGGPLVSNPHLSRRAARGARGGRRARGTARGRDRRD